MIGKLSKADERRIGSALTKCAAETKSIDDNKQLADAVYKCLSDELGDNPQLFKVACRVYNSCKSIHKLSTFSDKDRDQDFGLVDPNGLTDRLVKSKEISMLKSANAPATFTREVVSSEPMQKAASATTAKKSGLPKFAGTVSDAELRKFVLDEIADMERMIKEASNAVNSAEYKLQGAVERFNAHLSTEADTVRKEAAAILSANYGEDFDIIIKGFNTARPLCKIASKDYKNKYKGTPAVPDTPLFKAASDIFKAAEEQSVACAFQEEVMQQVAETAIFHTNNRLNKRADGLAKTLVRADVARDLADMVGFEDKDEEKIRNDIYTNKVINEAIGHSANRAFMRILMDPTISKYPLPKIVDAYNSALASLPINTRITPVTAHLALIKSNVINNLAADNVPSKADADRIIEMLGAYNRLRSDKGIIQGNI